MEKLGSRNNTITNNFKNLLPLSFMNLQFIEDPKKDGIF
jgi:hypothetical protein